MLGGNDLFIIRMVYRPIDSSDVFRMCERGLRALGDRITSGASSGKAPVGGLGDEFVP